MAIPQPGVDLARQALEKKNMFQKASDDLEAPLAEARQTALGELEDRAAQIGANAVVGVDLDYEVINNMLMVSASGTAVTIKRG